MGLAAEVVDPFLLAATRSMVSPRVRDDVDGTLLRAALDVLAERLGESYLIARSDGVPSYATLRARQLLAGAERLPDALTRRAQATLAGADDEPCAMLMLPGSRHAVSVWIAALPHTPCHVLCALRESGPHAALSRKLAERMGLSARATQLVVLASRGLKYKDIGQQLQLSEATVKTYMHALFRDLGIRSRAELGALLARMSNDA